MRFSTSNTVPMVSTLHQVTPNISNLKKVFSTLVSKLPHSHQKVGPMMVKTDTSQIRVTSKITAIKKENEMNRDVRNYYTSHKRQLEDVDNKKMELERETRHKTVKQYQQQVHHHWKEHSTVSINNNRSAQQPKWIYTHYTRDTRSNSNYLLKTAIINQCNLNTQHKVYLRKRADDFIWGKPSSLRHSINM